MVILGFFIFLILVSGLKIGSIYYGVYRKPLNYLKKNHYNMKEVYTVRRRHPSWVREDERHLYQ